MALCPTWYAAGKVMLDYVAALLMLPFALPVIALAALAVKMTSPGPVFYTQTRVGLSGRKYKIIKLRTMHHDCERCSGIQWAGKGTTASRGSAGSSAPRTSTNCRSCSTCCSAR